MTMNEIWGIMLALVVGLLLGALFFGGLWLTVQRGLTAKHPAVLFLISMLLRTGITLAGFYAVADHDSQRLVASLIGFVIVRLIATRVSRSGVEKVAQGAGHAS